MADIDASWVMRELRETLHRLSVDADAQLAYVASLGTGVDELALEFDAVAPVAPALVERGVISPEQAAAIRAVHEKLAVMSGGDKRALWTEEALASAEEWAEVRRAALTALRQLEK